MQDSQTNTFLKGMNLDTAKEFIGSDLYAYANDVHIVGDALSSASVQPYNDFYSYNAGELNLADHNILGSTKGQIYDSSVNGPVQCVIVFTEKDGENNIIALTLPDGKSYNDFSPKCVFKLSHNFGIDTNVKLVNVYETKEISRVYIAAPGSMINVININSTKSYETDHDFSIFPVCGFLTPFLFDAEVNGNLTAGKYQYAYQLFNKNGQTSALSVVSHQILCGNLLRNELTSIGFKLVLDTTKIKGDWEYIRIYALHYADNENTPSVYIKAENLFTPKSGKYTWFDTSSTYLSSLTLEEFNGIKNSVFGANTIETKDNVLFAAGILFIDWDVDFDARAYPADLNGYVTLTDSNGTVTKCLQRDIVSGKVKIKDDHDCQIDAETHKYNVICGNQHRLFIENYDFSIDDELVKGGAGMNVQYTFEHPLLYLDPFSDKYNNVKNTKWQDVGYISDRMRKNDYMGNVTDITIFRPKFVDESKWNYKPNDSVNVSHKIKNIDFSDTYVCANYTGFKQGEVYRFGVIFYNDRGQRTPVHWIGDITIPRLDNWFFSGVSTPSGYSHDLLALGVGITFRINTGSVPKDVVGFEIVRCDRTPNDRTILCQGLVSRTLSYVGASTIGRYITQSCVPSMNAVHDMYYDAANVHTPVYFLEEILTMVSPEIELAKESMDTYTKSIQRLYPVSILSGYILNNEKNLASDSSSSHKDKVFFKNLRIGVGATSFTNGKGKTVNLKDSFGVFMFGHVSGTQKDESDGIQLSLGDKNELRFGLFKFYLPCVTNDSLRDASTCDVDQAIFAEAGDFTLTGETISTKFISLRGEQFVNWGHCGDRDSHNFQGAHGPCLVFKMSVPDLATKCSAQQNDLEYGYDQRYAHMLKTGYDFTAKLSGKFDSINYITSHPIEDLIIANKLPDYSHFGNAYIDGDSSYLYDSTSELVGLKYIDQKNVLQKRLVNSVLLSDVMTTNSPYGGNVHSARINSTYISTGQYCACDNEDNYMSCYGGDTYVIIHDELWLQYVTSEKNGADYDKNVCVVAIKYPVETGINLTRAFGPNFSDNPDNPGIFYEPTQVNGYGQSEPLNAYNDAYSAHTTGKIYLSKGMWDVSNLYIPNRILHSDTKSCGELTDSFLNFKVANYLDVDNLFGAVTNMVNFNNNLLFFQDTACGYLSVNERSLINDNQSQLLLGTGGVLGAYQYYSHMFGNNKINDTSIVLAPAAIYWYDSLKKSILVLNSQIEPLSTLKGVLTYINTFVDDERVHGAYDCKYREVWFCAESKNESIVYSEQFEQFIGFYSKQIQHSVTMQDNSVTFGRDGNNGKVHSIGKNYEVYPDEGIPTIKFVVNKLPLVSKVFDAVATVNTFNESKLTSLNCRYTFETSRQSASEVTNSAANKYVEGVHYTYIPRDNNKERLRDRTMTIQMTFEPGTKFYIPSVSTIFRRSYI